MNPARNSQTMKTQTDSRTAGAPAGSLHPVVRRDVFGYFDSPEQTVPAYDPGLQAPCVVCTQSLLGKPVVTVSLMPDAIRQRSYFFRAHKECWNGISPQEQSAIESSLIDAICERKLLPGDDAWRKKKRLEAKKAKSGNDCVSDGADNR